MKRSMAATLGFMIGAWFCGLCLAQSATPPASQSQGDALKVLQKTSEVYRSMQSALFEGTYTMEFSSKQGNLKAEMPLVIAEVRPNRVRFELKDAKFGATRVSDGQTLWYYQPRTNQYTQNTISAETPAASLRAYTEYDSIAERVKAAKILREEALNVNGGSMSCYVIELISEPRNPNPDIVSEPRLLWVGKENYLVLKDYSRAKLNATKPESAQVINALTKVISVAKVNQPVPDALFVFVPPEGAKRVEKVD